MIGGYYNKEGKVWLMDLDNPLEEWCWIQDPDKYPFPSIEGLRYYRFNHTATLIGDNLFLFGGHDFDTKPHNDIQVLNVKVMTLKKYHGQRGEVPEPRASHGAVALDGSLYVFGGFGMGGLLNDLHQLATENLEDL